MSIDSADILGKWQQPAGQPFPGVWFLFKVDGTYRAEFEEMGITSGGTYVLDDDKIDMDQVQHTMGLVGRFLGWWAVEGDTLKMTLGLPNEARPADMSAARIYKKIG
jgi:hypothetical protein